MRLFNEEAQRLHQLEESPQIPRLLAHFDQTLTPPPAQRLAHSPHSHLT